MIAASRIENRSSPRLGYAFLMGRRSAASQHASKAAKLDKNGNLAALTHVFPKIRNIL